MLILTRKRGEKIVIPSCAVTITVLEIHGGRIRLGISAPLEVSVNRSELQFRLHGAVEADTRVGGE
jgi:carbon storage regulator